MQGKKDYEKIVFIILFITIILVSFLLLKPYLVTIISSIIIAYIFNPLYKKLYRKIGNPTLTSILMLLVIILIIIIPLAFIITAISQQAASGYLFAKDNIFELFASTDCVSGDLACRIIDFSKEYQLSSWLNDFFREGGAYIVALISSLVLKIPSFMLHLFILLFITYYLFKHGGIFIDYVLLTLSLKEQHKKAILKRIDNITFAVVYGHFLTALVQGILGGIGFLIFGFPNPILWGIAMAVAALVPFIGTAIVWVPAALVKLLISFAGHDSSGIVNGLLFTAYGIIIIGGIDNLIKPAIIGSRADIHPVVILLGVIGGISFMGIIGIIVGPLLLAILVTFIDIFNKEKQGGKGWT